MKRQVEESDSATKRTKVRLTTLGWTWMPSWRGAVLPAWSWLRERPPSSLDIGTRLALRSLAVRAEDVVADAQSDEPVQ